jgi:hypothetical protein
MTPFPKPKTGKKSYWCPRCKRYHRRNSQIGHLHKVYLEVP